MHSPSVYVEDDKIYISIVCHGGGRDYFKK